MEVVLIGIIPLFVLTGVCLHLIRRRPALTARFLAILSLIFGAEAIWIGYYASHAR